MQIQAGIYCRISDDQQNGWGVGDQEQHGHRIAEQMGWSVVEVYVDNDITATGRTRKRRRAYERMLSDIAAGHINGVIATETSRLHRRPLEWYQFRDLAEPHKVKIKTLSDYIDLETGEGVFAANLRAAIDEEEAEQIRRRVLRKHLSTAQAGKPLFGGHRPFGYRRVGSDQHHDPDGQALAAKRPEGIASPRRHRRHPLAPHRWRRARHLARDPRQG